MKVAIPIFQGRISPAFDWCREMLVVELDANRHEVSRNETKFEDSSPSGRARLLRELGVDVLLCGGISAQLACLIESSRAEVVPWVAGEVDTVLEAYLKGNVLQPEFMMPGRCCGRGGREFRHRHGRRGRNR